MNDIFSCSTFVLAHGIGPTPAGGIFLLIILTLFVFSLWIFRKNDKMPEGLFVSTIIPYVVVLVSLLPYYINLKILWIICTPFFMIAYYSNFVVLASFGSEDGFFLAAFLVDALIIFGIIRLILYVKHGISS